MAKKSWNGRTVWVPPDPPDATTEANSASSASDLFVEARRRHNLIARIMGYRRQGRTREAEEPFTFTPSDVTDAANEMLAQLKAGRITRQHVEMEQRADMDRLAGFRAAAPQPGSDLFERMRKVEYRMQVRQAALDAFARQELATLISSTARPGISVTDPVLRRPWRPGAAQDDGRY